MPHRPSAQAGDDDQQAVEQAVVGSHLEHAVLRSAYLIDQRPRGRLTRSPGCRPLVTATYRCRPAARSSMRGSKRSGAVLTQTIDWFAGFFISAS